MQEMMKKTHKKLTSIWHVFGCGCGAIGVIGILIVFTFVFYEYAESYKNPRWNRDDLAACQIRILSLKTSINNYRLAHKGSNPQKLADLEPQYIINKSVLNCPRANQKDAENYIYSPDAYNANDALITCRNHAQRVLILNGKLQVPMREKEKTYGIDLRDK